MAGNKWNPVEMRDNRYNQILHLVSAANGAEEFYSTEVSLVCVCVHLVKRLDLPLSLATPTKSKKRKRHYQVLDKCVMETTARSYLIVG